MHYVETVHVVKGEQELLDDVCCLPFRELSLASNHVKEVATRDQLHDDVVAAGVFHQFKDTSDMWMDCLLKHGQLVRV